MERHSLIFTKHPSSGAQPRLYEVNNGSSHDHVGSHIVISTMREDRIRRVPLARQVQGRPGDNMRHLLRVYRDQRVARPHPGTHIERSRRFSVHSRLPPGARNDV